MVFRVLLRKCTDQQFAYIWIGPFISSSLHSPMCVLSPYPLLPLLVPALASFLNKWLIMNDFFLVSLTFTMRIAKFDISDTIT